MANISIILILDKAFREQGSPRQIQHKNVQKVSVNPKLKLFKYWQSEVLNLYL